MDIKERCRARCEMRMAAATDQELSSFSFRVYFLLDDYARDKGMAWPHLATIAGMLGVSERNTKRAIKELRARGYIRSERSRTGNSYSLAWAGYPEKPHKGGASFNAARELAKLRRMTSAIDSQSLKAMDYGAFLQTDYWKTITAYVFHVRRGMCELCTSREHVQCHHKTYANHGFEHLHLMDLILLCDSCHAKFHDKLPKAGQAA